MGRKPEDLTGRRFGMLVANFPIGKRNGSILWSCTCDCGKNNHQVTARGLMGNTSNSCGCQRGNPGQENGRAIDLTGKKFGRLTVISRAGVGSGERVTWLCICDCGKEVIVIGVNLRKGLTSSCGCLKRYFLSLRFSKPFGESSINRVYGRYKTEAKERNLCFEISKEYFEKISQLKCSYCHCLPKNSQKSKANNGNFIYNGMDRVDSNLGYVEHNVVPCCWDCNRMKGDMTMKDFLNQVEKIYKHSILHEGIDNEQS